MDPSMTQAADMMDYEYDGMPLTFDVVKSFKPSKVFQTNRRPLSSLSFDDTGEYCVTSAEDESITVFNCHEGTQSKSLFSKKYGVSLARFTHGRNTIIHASTKEDDTIRYLSLHDNKYLRYFRGHKKRVICLEMSPSDDQFMSASLDETVRLWDLRSPSCKGVVHVSGRPTVAFDTMGLVFAVGLNSNTVKMYDLRAYETGPFATWTIHDQEMSPMGLPPWTSLKFTASGKHILITTVGQRHYIIDAFNGAMKQRLIDHTKQNVDYCGEETGLSPDGRYVFSGNQNNELTVWDIKNVNPDSPHIEDNHIKTTLQTPHTQPVRVFGFNPYHMMMASGSNDLALWLPSL